MDLQLFAIKDKAQGFLTVFQEKNKMMALRAIDQAVNGKQETLMSQSPQDFSLFSLGTFNTDTGVITSEVSFIEEVCNIKK